MSAINLFLFFIITSGISLSLIFSFILWRWEQKPPYSNQILALLLIFLSLRISKSIFYNFVELPLFVKNLGLAFNLAVAPLLMLYGLSLFKPDFSLKKAHALHFIPSAFYLLFCTLIPNAPDNIWWQSSYSLVLLQSFIYVFLSLMIWNSRAPKSEIKAQWYLGITTGLGAMWCVYLLIFLGLIPVYLAGAFSFTLLIGILTFLLLSKKSILEGVFLKKYKASNLQKEQSILIMKKVEQLLREEQLFLDPKLSLNSLAQKVGISSKKLSQVINENTGHNFAFLINSYRIRHAKQLFSHPDTKYVKIIAIALESGFNSLSSFNAVFKKQVGMTPSQFRQIHVNHP